MRGRGQQFQGPGFRVFGQNLKNQHKRTQQAAFICCRPVFKMAVTAVPTASASRKGQAWCLHQNGLVLDLGPTRRHRFHLLPMPASGRFTPSISPLPTSASFSDDNRSPPPHLPTPQPPLPNALIQAATWFELRCRSPWSPQWAHLMRSG